MLAQPKKNALDEEAKSKKELEDRLKLIEDMLTNQNSEVKDKDHEDNLKKCEEYMRHEFQFFKDISNIGVDLYKLMPKLKFFRSLEV